MASKNNKEQAKLSLTEEQNRVAEALVFSGVNYERQRLVSILEPYRGKAVNVDTMIDVINNVMPKTDDVQESE